MDALVEFSDARQDQLPHGLSQSMEFSADRHACRGIARRLLLGDLDGTYAEALLSRLSVNKDVFFVRILTTAVTLLFHLFPKRFCSFARLEGSHPHPYTRMQWIAMELGHEVGGEIDFRESILRPLAETAATLKSNFHSPDDWLRYTELDLRAISGERRIPFTDRLYAEIKALTKTWQTETEPYRPKYGHSSGRWQDPE